MPQEGFGQEVVAVYGLITSQFMYLTDIDECSELSHDCNTTYAECRDTDGSFECVCSTGYVGNGSSCEGN